jgi:four helix bundle protein
METYSGRVNSYKELVVWQKIVGLVTEIYSATSKFPREEIYGLTSQLRRSAVSVPSNIAEGQGRATRGEFVQFLGNARGSLCELQTQSLAQEESLVARADEVGRILKHPQRVVNFARRPSPKTNH